MRLCLLLLALGLGLLPDPASAQVRRLSVEGGPLLLAIGTTGGFAGQELPPVVSTATGLSWQWVGQMAKITVTNSAPGQRYTLRLEATNITTSGTAQPEITLADGMFARDLIRNITHQGSGVPGSCVLRYTASATIAQGASPTPDQHLITFTLIEQ
jgi:hypothetical protein